MDKINFLKVKGASGNEYKFSFHEYFSQFNKNVFGVFSFTIKYINGNYGLRYIGEGNVSEGVQKARSEKPDMPKDGCSLILFHEEINADKRKQILKDIMANDPNIEKIQ